MPTYPAPAVSQADEGGDPAGCVRLSHDPGVVRGARSAAVLPNSNLVRTTRRLRVSFAIVEGAPRRA